MSLTYRFPSRVDASPINLMLSACQLCTVHQPEIASQLLYGLLEIRLKVTNVELPQLVIVSQTLAMATHVHTILDRDGGREVDGAVRRLSPLRQEVNEDLPDQRELCALLL